MAINVNFNGATIYKPGAYSKTTIDLGGGFPLGATGLVAIFGEADAGTPGAQEVNIADNVFSPEQFAQIKAKYKKGPIVDACAMLFAPGADGAVPSGAQAVYIYKTNNSTQAMLDPVAAGGGVNDFGRLRAREWGLGGNQVSFKATLVPEIAARVVSSPIAFPVTITTGVDDELKIIENGGAEATYTIASGTYNNLTALITAINAALPSSLTCLAGTAPNTLVITQTASATHHRNGWGRSIQVTNGSANAALGLTNYSFAVPSSETKVILKVKHAVTTLEESDTVGGEVVMMLGRDNSGGCTAASVAITSTDVILTQTGASPTFYTISKAAYPSIQSLCDYISTLPGWTATPANATLGAKSLDILDQVSSAGALYLGSTVQKPARIKQDAFKVAEFFSLSTLVELIPLITATTVKKVGLVDQQGVPNAIYLSGGTKGATTSADIVNALAKFEKIRVNAIVPLFSRDASADIADQLTEPTSSYTIAGIHQAVKTHLSVMSTTKRKSERQAYLSIKALYTDCKDVAANLAYHRIQLTIQDIKQVDSEGNIKWFQPWALSCLLAGARSGSPIGNPMTFKYLNMSGVRHTPQPMSTPEQNIVIDFDPDVQYDDAIQSGITFVEAPQTGGYRVVVDNTTYGKDSNWVLNRGHVVYAADVLAFDFRNQLENIYVGLKNTVSAAEIKTTCESILATYLAQGITVSTPDAKNGYKDLIVQINGNTVNISVTVKLVEGIDFVLSDITLQRNTQTA